MGRRAGMLPNIKNKAVIALNNLAPQQIMNMTCSEIHSIFSSAETFERDFKLLNPAVKLAVFEKLNKNISFNSNNTKTGIGVAVTSNRRFYNASKKLIGCPSNCIFIKNGCYGDNYFIKNKHEYIISWVDNSTFFENIEHSLDSFQFRVNEAGDLDARKDNADLIDESYLLSLSYSLRNKKAKWSYTHFNWRIKHNLEITQHVTRDGFVINQSLNTLTECEEYFNHVKTNRVGVVTLHSTQITNFKKNSIRYIICPAYKSDKVTCAKCNICKMLDRDFILGLPAHGNGKSKVDALCINNKE